MPATQVLNKRILIIDDQQIVITALTQILGDWGYSVSSYIDPVEALRAMKQQAYFLIICDLYMPGLNGHNLLYQFLKEIPGQKCCLLTSAENDDPLIKKTIRLNNVKGLLKKPVSIDKLALMLAQIKSEPA